MTLRYYERKVGDKVFHYARTCETKEEAAEEAKRFREKGYKTRVIPVNTLMMGTQFQVFVYPKEKIGRG
jgi:hypothetical protein